MEESGQRITSLPATPSPAAAEGKSNPARAVQGFVGQVMSTAMQPVDMLNLGVAKATLGFVRMLPKMPAARLFGDLVFGWPHAHSHPPNLIPPVPPIPLPSIGPVICAGAVSVLINGLPSARVGDLGFGVWCGGFFPIFEVQTGSSHVFIGGSRPARMLIDFTRHCLPGVPGFNKLGAAMMAFSAGMGALGVAAALTDKAHAEEAAEAAGTEEEAMAASASAAAQGVGAAVGAIQTAADLVAAALQMMMGKDPAIPPGIPIGNFITGSPNVVIGGFPMPGWMAILRGLGKLRRPLVRKAPPTLPKGSRSPNGRCATEGHPVDVASGRVFTAQKDFELVGRIPVVFERAYDTSAVDYAGPLGPGWIHPYDIHLWEDDSQGMIVLRNEEARVVGFPLIAPGEKVFNPLEKQWLERVDETIYLVRNSEGRKYRFEPIESAEMDGTELGKSEASALKLTLVADRNGNQIRLFYRDGYLSRMEDSAGRRILFSYLTLENGAHRLASVSLALNAKNAKDADSERTARLVNYSYDAEGHLISATDCGLVPWRYAYHDDLLTRETNRNGLSFHFSYQGKGSQARCVHTWGDRGIYARRLTYDGKVKRTIVEDSFGHKTTYYFNELDLPVSIVDALGGTKRYSYDPNGELLSETDEAGRTTKYSYNETGDCISITHPDQTTRRFEYTGDSLLQKLIDEMGAEFTREYDDCGNIIATVDALGNRHKYSYNEFGDLEQAIDPLGGVAKLKWNERGQTIEFTTPGGATTRYGYDERGRLISISDPLGRAMRYTYDALDRLVQIERPDGSRHHYQYDPEGNLTNSLDANGIETRFRYIDYNKLGERIDAMGFRRRFIYNTEANLIEIRNERDEAYRLTYDALNRLTREVGFDGLKSEYDYDPAGQLIARTDPAGRVTHFIRDLRGRVTERQRPDGTTISFRYDNGDRLIEAIAPGSELVFKFDALGQAVWESQNGKVIEHEYDRLGRRIKRRSPSGEAVEFTYDIDSLLSRLETPRGSIEFEYDKAGQITKRQMPGGLEESFYYDQCGRIIEQSLHKPSHTLFHRGYKYDAEGNLIELNDSNRGVSRFVYDPLERLRHVSRPEKGLEQFVYDSTGNLLQKGAREFRYGAPDRLTQTDDATLVYDDLGNLIEKRRPRSVIRYSYDPDSRLTAVESKEGGRIEFAYDAFGRRIAKKTKDGVTRFLWDGDVLLAEQRSDRSNEYVFELDSYGPLCRFDEEGFETYHNDHLGTPCELTDEGGQIVWSVTYDVYGQIDQMHSDNIETPIRFQGQYEDYEIRLCYNFYRYFDPESGRYITTDPVGLWGGLNHYAYTPNPVNWVDPLGLITWQDYENHVRQLYGNTPFSARQYRAIVDGRVENGVADNVAVIGGKNVAIEAKYVSSWEKSIRNPLGAVREKAFAIRAQREVIAQARRYSAAFDEVIYHSNSIEFIQRYSRKFAKLGLSNIRFVHTTC